MPSQTNATPAPHIGHLIRQAMEQQRVSQAELARRTNLSQTAVTLALRKPTIQVAQLWKIGQALQHNFFTELGNGYLANTGDAVATQRELEMEQQLIALQQQLANVQQQLSDAQKESALYQKVLETLGRK